MKRRGRPQRQPLQPQPEPEPEPEPELVLTPVPELQPEQRLAGGTLGLDGQCIVVRICLDQLDTGTEVSPSLEESVLAEEHLAVYETAVTEVLAEAGQADIVVDVESSAPDVEIYARFSSNTEATAALSMLLREKDPIVQARASSDNQFQRALGQRAKRAQAIQVARRCSPEQLDDEPTLESPGPTRVPSPRNEWQLPVDVDVKQLTAQIAELEAEVQRLASAPVPHDGDAHRLSKLRQWIAAAQTVIDQHYRNVGETSPSRLSLSPVGSPDRQCALHRSPQSRGGDQVAGQPRDSDRNSGYASSGIKYVSSKTKPKSHRIVKRKVNIADRDAALEQVHSALLGYELRHLVVHEHVSCHIGARPQIRASTLSRALSSMRLDRGVVAEIVDLVSVDGETEQGDLMVSVDQLLDKAFLGHIACLRRRICAGQLDLDREHVQHIFSFLDSEGTGSVPISTIDDFFRSSSVLVESNHSVVSQAILHVATCLSRDAVDGQLREQLAEAFEEVSGGSSESERNWASGSLDRGRDRSPATDRPLMVDDEHLQAACDFLGVALTPYQAVIIVIALDVEGCGMISAQQLAQRLLYTTPSLPPTLVRDKPVSLTGIWCAEGLENGSTAPIIERFQLYETEHGVLTGHECDGEDPFAIIHGRVSGQGAWLSFDQRYSTGQVTVWRAALQRTSTQAVMVDGLWSGELNGTFFARMEDANGNDSDSEASLIDGWNSGRRTTRPNWRAKKKQPDSLDLEAFYVYLEDIATRQPNIHRADASVELEDVAHMKPRAVIHTLDSTRALVQLEEAQAAAASVLQSAQRLRGDQSVCSTHELPGCTTVTTGARRLSTAHNVPSVAISRSGAGVGMTFRGEQPSGTHPPSPSLKPADLTGRSSLRETPTPEFYSASVQPQPHVAALEINPQVDLSGKWDLNSEDEHGITDKMYLVRAKTLPPANGMLKITVLGCPGIDAMTDREVALTVELSFPTMSDSMVSGPPCMKRVQMEPAVLAGTSRLGKHAQHRMPNYHVGNQPVWCTHSDSVQELTVPLLSWLEIVDSIHENGCSTIIADEADLRFGPEGLERLMEKAYTLTVNVWRCPHGSCKGTARHTSRCVHIGATEIDIREAMQDDWAREWTGVRPLVPNDQRSVQRSTAGCDDVLVGDEYVVLPQHWKNEKEKIRLMGKNARVTIEESHLPLEYNRDHLGRTGVGIVESVEQFRQSGGAVLHVRSENGELREYQAIHMRPVPYVVREELDIHSPICGYVAEGDLLTGLEDRVDADGVTHIRFRRSPGNVNIDDLQGWIPCTNPKYGNKDGPKILQKRSARAGRNRWSLPAMAWPSPKEIDARVGHRGGRFLIDDIDTPARREELLSSNPYGAVSLNLQYSAGAVVDTSTNPVRILVIPTSTGGASTITHALHFQRAVRGLTSLFSGVLCHIYGSERELADGSFRVSEVVSGGKELLLEQIADSPAAHTGATSPISIRSPSRASPAGSPMINCPEEREQRTGNIVIVVGQRLQGADNTGHDPNSSGAHTDTEGVTSHAEGWVGSATIPFAAVAAVSQSVPADTSTRQVVAIRRGLVSTAVDRSRGGAQTLHFSCEAIAMPTSFDRVQFGPYERGIERTFLLPDQKDAAGFRYSSNLERRLIAQRLPRFMWHATVLESAGEGLALCEGTQIVQSPMDGEQSRPSLERVMRFEARQLGKDSFQLALRQANEALKACQAVELPDQFTADPSHQIGQLTRQKGSRSVRRDSPPEQQLPAGWVSRVSRSTGDTYYVNTTTQDSTYTFPSDPSSEADPAAVLHVTIEVEGPLGMTVGDGGRVQSVKAGSWAERRMITNAHTIQSVDGVPVMSQDTSEFITDKLRRRPVKVVFSAERPTRQF